MTLAGVLLTISVLVFGQGTYRVSAAASIEGLVQRAVVAPFDGYIAEANVRAGDTVSAGDVIARMDDRELLLELRRSTSEEEKLNNEYRKALASLDRSEARIVQTRLAQVQAKSTLLQQKLERTQLRAPLGGIVITGDLSRSLGAPVERGQVLFEVAPLHEYRLVLKVDEQEIANIEEGQLAVADSAAPGTLALCYRSGISDLPGRGWPGQLPYRGPYRGRHRTAPTRHGGSGQD